MIEVGLLIGGYVLAWALLDSLQSLRFVVAAGAVLLLFWFRRIAALGDTVSQLSADVTEQTKQQTELLKEVGEVWAGLRKTTELSGENSRFVLDLSRELADRVTALEAYHQTDTDDGSSKG